MLLARSCESFRNPVFVGFEIRTNFTASFSLIMLGIEPRALAVRQMLATGSVQLSFNLRGGELQKDPIGAKKLQKRSSHVWRLGGLLLAVFPFSVRLKAVIPSFLSF